GEQNRKEIEKHAGDLNSNDKDKRAAAEKAVEDVANKANAEKDAAHEAKRKADQKAVDQAVEDLKNGDPAKREQAKKTLDKNLGDGAGELAEYAAEDLKDSDPRKQARGQKALDDLKDRAKQLNRPELKQNDVKENIGDNRPRPPMTPEQQKQE